MKKILSTIILGIFGLLLPTKCGAVAGLRTTFGEVLIENLVIGETYNLREFANLPLKVTNKGEEPINLQIEVIVPKKEEVKEGYEPIPSASWITLGQGYFVLGPGEDAITDVIISIPDDEKYLGKAYQTYIFSHTVGRPGVALGLQSRLLFTIAPTREGKVGKPVKPLATLNFEIVPHEIVLQNVPIGKKQSVKELSGKTLRILNPNDEAYMFKLESISLKDSLWKPKEKFEEVDPSFLTFSKLKFKVKGKSIKEIKLYLNFPRDELYAGKTYIFIIRAEVLEQEIPVSMYSKLYVTTER